jgi:hypothetical protein
MPGLENEKKMQEHNGAEQKENITNCNPSKLQILRRKKKNRNYSYRHSPRCQGTEESSRSAWQLCKKKKSMSSRRAAVIGLLE